MFIDTVLGKWMIFVPRERRGIVCRTIIDELKRRQLDYKAKIVGVKEPDRDGYPYDNVCFKLSSSEHCC